MSGGSVFWFTGLSGSGKSTLCQALARELSARDVRVHVIDGDEIRNTLCSDLTFSVEDRKENIRRIIYLAETIARCGVIAIVGAITPLRAMRKQAREALHPYYEIYVDAPYSVCESRDVKGLYRGARDGKIKEFTGLDSIFEEPLNPDVVCHTARETVDQSTRKILEFSLLTMHETQSQIVAKRKTIAVDFDGVIADYNGWLGPRSFGDPRKDVVSALRTLVEEGWKVIVYTCRRTVDVLSYLEYHKIPFHEVNRNSDYHSQHSKPVATVYWDDRALRYSGDAMLDLEIIRTFKTWNGRT